MHYLHVSISKMGYQFINNLYAEKLQYSFYWFMNCYKLKEQVIFLYVNADRFRRGESPSNQLRFILPMSINGPL